MTAPIAQQPNQYLEEFSRLRGEKDLPRLPWLEPLREQGIAQFGQLGLPTTQQEDWRFTNLAPLLDLPFRPVHQRAALTPNSKDLKKLLFGGVVATRLVFVDGQFSAGLSSPPVQGAGYVGSLLQGHDAHPELIDQNLARYAPPSENGFTALNAAFLQDGAFIHVPAATILPQPVHLVYVSTGRQAGGAAHVRNLVLAGPGSQLTVLESYVSVGNAPTLTNAVTELAVGRDAVVEYCKVQDEHPEAFHIAQIAMHLEQGANVLAHSFSLGARLARNNLRALLSGQAVECVLNGLYLTGGQQLADHHMIVDHAAAGCNSHEYFNGVLAGHSKGVFHGRIHVRQAAQKTDAKQTNKNLLLSDDATINTKPQLEIYADDVKCTHGATVGQLDEESIFYLRARGIPLTRARHILIHSFAGEIVQRVRCEPAREELDQYIWNRLEQYSQP